MTPLLEALSGSVINASGAASLLVLLETMTRYGSSLVYLSLPAAGEGDGSVDSSSVGGSTCHASSDRGRSSSVGGSSTGSNGLGNSSSSGGGGSGNDEEPACQRLVHRVLRAVESIALDVVRQKSTEQIAMEL